MCDVAVLQEQLLAADSRVAQVQGSFTAPLSELQQAATVSLWLQGSLLHQVQVSSHGACFCPTEGGKHRERSETAGNGRG